jgi:hypothetical protein
MGLPAQIQQQLDAAEAIQKQLAQPPEAEAETKDTEPAEEAKETPSVEVATEPAPAVEPKNDEYGLLEQRYRSLQGMWQSANARLQKAEAQNSELAEKLQEAIDKLEKVAQAKPAEPKPSSLVTDKDAEAFGTDLIDLARRVAKEQFGEREQQLLGEISALKQHLAAQDQKLGSVAQSQVVSAQDRFYGALDSGLPQWESIQGTPEAQQWLQTRVPGTRTTWNDALLAAAQEFDAPRALEVFETFLALHPQLDARKKQVAPDQSKKAELQRQVAPSKSASAPAASTGKKTYSAAEYSSEMDRVVRMNKARQYDDATALERELDAALSEGRVTP